eukprot:234136_1
MGGGAWPLARITFSIFTIITILFVLCFHRYLQSCAKKSAESIVIKNHEINPRFRSREYVILSLIFVIQWIFLIDDFNILNNGQNASNLTAGSTWGLTLIELQLLLVWYLQEQRQISELNMILRILSLSFTLFFGWVFLLFLLFHNVKEMRISLFIIFTINLILSIISIIHNVVFKSSIKYIKIQSPLKPWLVNIILLLLAIISLIEMLSGVPLDEAEARQSFKAFITSYRVLTFICTLFICFMITVRRKKETETTLTVGGNYKKDKTPHEFHDRTLSLMRDHNKYGSQIKLAKTDESETEELNSTHSRELKEDETEDAPGLMAIPELMEGFKTIELKKRDDDQKAMETMYEYGRREGNKSWQSVAATFIGGEGVGKTLLIRALWKLDISRIDPKYNTKYKKKQKHQRKQSQGRRLSNADNPYATLEDYDRYNMIDLYRRWDPDLRVKFKFWDTVGDVRFLNSILQCMLSSEVIVAMYSLEVEPFEDVEPVAAEKTEQIPKARTKLMNVHETVRFLLAVELKIRQLVSITHRKDEVGADLKFAVLLVGISRRRIDDTLRQKNKQIFESLRTQCQHLKFITYPSTEGDPSQIFHINYEQSHPEMTSLVQILWSIYQVKKSALSNGFILDSRTCGGLIKIPNAPIYKISANLAQTIKRQPFVLRKIDSRKILTRSRAQTMRRGSKSMSIVEYRERLQKKDKRQVVGGPIASVHHWKLRRPKSVILLRTFGCLISGMFFPFLVVMQTTMFWCYCAEWGISNEGLSRLVSNYRISQYGTFLLDFLYPIFPRSQPDPAVESAINTGLRGLLNQKQSGNKKGGGIYKIDWFFRQTNIQKVVRTLIAFCIVLLATFLVYNLSHWMNVDGTQREVSTAESVGGLFWFGIIWLMMGSWYGHQVNVIPDVDAMFADEDRTSFRLHYKDTSFGKDLIHTNVEVFLRSYTFFHNANQKTQSGLCKTFSFVLIGVLYALIPGLHRVIIQDQPFIVENHPYTCTRAIVANLVLVSLVNYVFDKAFYSYFQQYARLIFDVTTIIEIPGDDEEKDEEELDVQDDMAPSYAGSGFEFLSLDDPENLISWLEIRSYAYVKGRQLFAELELFIAFFCVIMVVMAGFVVLTLFEYAGEDHEALSATFFCVVFMLLINLGWMVKVFILGTTFDQLQRRQMYALVNQMTCIRAEALTTALFTGPIGWIELNVGAWDKLYNLLHERRKRYNRKQRQKNQRAMNKQFNMTMALTDVSDTDDDDDDEKETETVYKRKYERLKGNIERYLTDEHQEEEKWKEMRSLQEDFDHYLDLLQLAYYKIQQNSIHPKIFGLGLSGALMKTMAAATVTTFFAVIRFVFVA